MIMMSQISKMKNVNQEMMKILKMKKRNNKKNNKKISFE